MNERKIMRAPALARFEIGLKVRETMQRGSTGFWSYKPGWNDEAVAAFVAEKTKCSGLTKSHVVPIRRAVCGIMKPRTTPGAAHAPTADHDRIEMLEQWCKALSKRIEEMEHKFYQQDEPLILRRA